jgi:hypothetical protein
MGKRSISSKIEDQYRIFTLKRKEAERYGTEPEICARFGCRNRLSLREQLCGKYCVLHQPKGEHI